MRQAPFTNATFLQASLLIGWDYHCQIVLCSLGNVGLFYVRVFFEPNLKIPIFQGPRSQLCMYVMHHASQASVKNGKFNVLLIREEDQVDSGQMSICLGASISSPWFSSIASWNLKSL